MVSRLKIDFIGDITCPWCAIGFGGLQTALEQLKGEAPAEITFQPFELNPGMHNKGVNLDEHLGALYAATPERLALSRVAVRDRAAAIGLAIVQDGASRIYNTFDAHRLMRWAAETGHEVPLIRALFAAYFSYNEDISSRPVLAAVAEVAGLDPEAAFQMLRSSRYVTEVQAAEQHWRMAGINSVPAVIINDKYLILGGQPPEGYVQQLRDIWLRRPEP